MKITHINALTRYGPYPNSGLRQAGSARRVDSTPVDTHTATRGTGQPVEYVVQGELLQKRRDSLSNDASYYQLYATRNKDRVLPQNALSSDSGDTSGRDSRRAIANYMATSMIPNTLTGSTAPAYINYYV